MATCDSLELLLKSLTDEVSKLKKAQSGTKKQPSLASLTSQLKKAQADIATLAKLNRQLEARVNLLDGKGNSLNYIIDQVIQAIEKKLLGTGGVVVSAVEKALTILLRSLGLDKLGNRLSGIEAQAKVLKSGMVRLENEQKQDDQEFAKIAAAAVATAATIKILNTRTEATKTKVEVLEPKIGDLVLGNQKQEAKITDLVLGNQRQDREIDDLENDLKGVEASAVAKAVATSTTITTGLLAKAAITTTFALGLVDANANNAMLEAKKGVSLANESLRNDQNLQQQINALGNKQVQVIDRPVIVQQPVFIDKVQIVDKLQFVDKPVITEKVITLKEPVITEKVVTVDKLIPQDKLQFVDKTVITEKVVTVDKPIITDKITSVDKPIITERVITVDKPIVTEKLVFADKPIITKEIEKVDRPIITEKVITTNNTVVTKEIEKVNNTVVTEKVVPVNQSVVTEKLVTVNQPVVTQQVVTVNNAVVTTKVEKVDNPVIRDKVVTVNQPVVTKEVVNTKETIVQKELVQSEKTVVQTQVKEVTVPLVIEEKLTCSRVAELANCFPKPTTEIKEITYIDCSDKCTTAKVLTIELEVKKDALTPDKAAKLLQNTSLAYQGCGYEPTIAVPEWWQERPEYARPQLIVSFAEYDKIKKKLVSSAMYTVTIPHWKGAKPTKSPISEYQSGKHQRILRLKDNSKVIVFAENEATATKVLGEARKVINPAQLVGALELPGGNLVGSKRLERSKLYYPRVLTYYSTGLRAGVKPDWIVNLPKPV